MPIALTRDISDSIALCELTHLDREPIDLPRARAQHAAYEETLERLGCRLLRLPQDPAFPDAVFVEDTAVVLDEIAVITRPGAPSRRGETAAIAAALAPHRPLHEMREPSTLDGGDVLRFGRTLFVGLSGRSNAAGADELRRSVASFGWEVREVTLSGCLHLKTAVTAVAPGTLLVNPEWVDPSLFGARQVIEVDPAEPFAANALAIGGTLVHPASATRTRRRLEAAGLPVVPVEIGELAKAESGVTCSSLVFEERRG